MGLFGRAAAALAILALAACSSSRNPNAGNPCPAIVAAPAADSIFLFAPGGRERKDVIIAAKLYELRVSCTRVKTGLSVASEISFYAERVSNLVKDTTLPYFVALVDPAQHVLMERSFEVPIQFLPGEGFRRTPPEKITVDLPIRDRASATGYSVIVGFQLTPDQLAFNRSVRAP
jgi:hypothetical protein